jgi:hypothetical protein
LAIDATGAFIIAGPTVTEIGTAAANAAAAAASAAGALASEGAAGISADEAAASALLAAGGIPWIIKTTTYTAETKNAIVADTSGGAWTLTLPASPLAGAYVQLLDGGNWFTNNLTVARNGQTIEGDAEDLVINIGNIAVDIVFDGTTWQVVAQVGAQGGNVLLASNNLSEVIPATARTNLELGAVATQNFSTFTEATTDSGVNTSVMSPLRVEQKIAANKGPDYDSGEIAIPANAASITALVHGLGAAPSFVKALLICKVADQGYSIGDIVDLSYMTNDSATANYGLGLRWTATNINAVTAQSGIAVVSTSTGEGEPIVRTSWRLIFRAWL